MFIIQNIFGFATKFAINGLDILDCGVAVGLRNSPFPGLQLANHDFGPFLSPGFSSSIGKTLDMVAIFVNTFYFGRSLSNLGLFDFIR